MEAATDRLLALRVSDVMTQDVARVFPSHTMAQAAEIFTRHKVSSAPVVDESGTCIGILSATDFLSRDQEARGREGNRAETVLDCMTPTVFSVALGSSLLTAARVMDDKHVHRLPVIGESGCPVGSVSTMDIVATMINAIDELKSSLSNS